MDQLEDNVFPSLYNRIVKENLGSVIDFNLVLTRDGYEIAFGFLAYGHFIKRDTLEYAREVIGDTLAYYDRVGLTDENIELINKALSDELFNYERTRFTKEKKKKKSKRGKATVIYVIRDSKSSSIKVGKSVNPKSRLNGHQTSNPNMLELVFEHKGFDIDEKNLHQQLIDAGFHIHGEWFKDCQEAIDIVNGYFNKGEPQCQDSSE